jgi:hypothetical protein
MEEFSNILQRQSTRAVVARLHSKRGAMHEINVVPYVDVMLVLLVIFMVTAPLVTPGVIDLPSVGKAGQPKLVPLEVIIKEDRSLSVRERDAADASSTTRPSSAPSSPSSSKIRRCRCWSRRQERALRGGAAGDG